MRVVKQSTARTVAIFMTDSSDHVTGKTGLTLTVTASKNGAAFASISPTAAELANGWYTLALTTSHTDTLGDLAIHVTGTGADPTDLLIQVVAYDFGSATSLGLSNLDAAITSRLAPTVASRTLDVSATGEAGIDLANVGSPTTTLNLSGTTIKTATDVEADTADIQSRLPAALVSGRIDASVGAMASGVLTATAIASDAITAAKIATGAITAAKFASGAIDSAALDSTAATEIATAVWGTTVPGAFSSGTAGHSLGNVATGTPPTASAIADAVWDEALSGHATAGTTGAALSASGSPPTAATIADAVWDEAASGHATSGTFGKYLADILDDTGTSGVKLTSAGLDNIVIETGCNARQALSIIAAVSAGTASGAGTGTFTIKGIGVATTRLTSAYDGGDRDTVTLSLPA